MKAIGIDPGLSGAMALYDSETWELEVRDLPVATVEKSGRKKGQRQLDMAPLQALLASWVVYDGAKLILLEQVSANPKDGVASAFSFGRTYGQIEACAISALVRLERVAPVRWKKVMKCPTEPAAIAQRADEIFPEYRGLWRGPRGGILHDRAEAALLAKYATQEFSK